MRQLTAQDVHEAWLRSQQKHSENSRKLSTLVFKLPAWEDVSEPSRTLYEEMAELLNKKLAEEVPNA